MRAILVLVGAAVWLCSGCNMDLCGDTFEWSAEVPGPVGADIGRLTVRACRNGVCLEGSVDPRGPSSVTILDPDVPGSYAGIMVERRSDGSYRVRVYSYVPDPVDGDRYEVVVTNASGEVVAGLAQQSVDYDEYWASGWSATEPACRSVVLEGSTLGEP